jgi:radical SAM superfamily enzyme YgiQ (UPF0313 family)
MIWTSYPRYHGHVIRPPSEANSLILQVMYGCSHGDCTFCGSYLDKPFRVRPFDEVIEDVQNLPAGYKQHIDRVFLADGDALAIPRRRMLELLDLLKAELPHVQRISAYANAHSLLRLPQEDLLEIRRHGLELLYLGLESGDDVTLEGIKKGVTVAQQIEGCRKAKAAGFAMSVTAILGIGGEDRTHEHAIGTGKALSAIDPEYIGILSLMLESGTEMTDAVRSGRFIVPKPLDLLRELREIIANIDVSHAVFRSNHASNYLPLRGTLPQDKAALLESLDRVIDMGGKARLKPEGWRAL